MAQSRPCWWAFSLLLSIYLMSAWNMVILDCDETFNYLEPLHHLLYGHGLQTWEYGPQYALRPYSFLLLFSAPLQLLTKIFRIKDRVAVYKLLRGMIGGMSAYSQSHLLHTISTHLNPQVSLYALLIMASTTGMSAASPSFLPNTFSMILLTLVWSFWLRGHDSKVMILTAMSTVLGWPYATIGAVIPILFSLKETYQLKDGQTVSVAILGSRIQFDLFIRRLVIGSIFGLTYIACPSLIIERLYYGRWLFPSMNAIIYNIVGGSGGPDLYGTEHWSYYCLNMALNFSIFFPLALLTPIAAMFSGTRKRAFLLWLSFLAPFTIFSLQAHKEERFLYSFYPLACISAAISLNFVGRLHRSLVFVILLGGALIGISRTTALIKFYSGPQSVLENWNQAPIRAPSIVCMSSSWYRFPGSFYLRDSDRLGFIPGASDGQLPMYYTSTTAPVAMNDMNKAIDAQFTQRSKCDYFMGLESEFGRDLTFVTCSRIANAGITPAPFKWLWIPYLSETRTHWDPFCIYKNEQTS